MKKRIYFILIFLSIVVTVVSLLYNLQSLNKLIDQKAKETFENRIKEYNVLYENKKTFLDAFAKFLTSSPIIINAYLKNNRQMIINYLKPLYENLHKAGIIEEIHFFKAPAISFVNFANLKKYDINVSKSRADILWVDTSFQPSTHYYVCRLYPGLRATYPIVYKGRVLGSLSFGLNIKIFKQLFEKIGAENVSIYLNNDILKKMLLPQKYKEYAKLPTYENYKVLGKVFKNIDLNPGFEVKNNYVFTKIKISDFFGHPMAYLVIKDDIKQSIATIKRILVEKTIIELLGFLVAFGIVFILFRWIFTKMEDINKILTLIKEQKFSQIPQKTTPKDELDIYKNNLIEVAQKIKTYFNILSEKVEEYSDKAYKDGLTEALNRRFLEEKANQLFTKYSLKKTKVGIVMLDIDNFKHINDNFGHDIGDLIITKLADTIKSIIRKEDFLIRYGGEEFLLILPNSSLQDTYKVAEKIRKAIENLEVKIGNKNLKFTISVGVSELNSFDKTLFDAIKRADINLYKAKQNGKNRVEI